MKKGNIALVAAGYLAGLAVALKFNKKPPTIIKDEMNSDDAYMNMGKNIVDIHKNIFESAEASIFSDANKKRVAEYEKNLMNEVHAFQKDMEVLLLKLEEKGVEKYEEIEAEIHDLYDQRVTFMKRIQEKGIEFVEDVESDGTNLIKEGMNMANQLFENVKNNLDTVYSDAKKRLKK
ncbi:MAG: hypothetical protein PHU93_01870 [Candidatus Gracilibacteria bacterium]|nr:hypothetical protein [Candidatus Gracilibacteria bacterium]